MTDYGSFISIDTETTGLDFVDDRIIQFGAAVFIRGKEVHNESFYIQCDRENKGFAVNQITDAQIAGGEPPAQAFWLISQLLNKPINNAYPRIVVYNAPFDLGMILNEFRRRDIEYNIKHIHILDPLVMWRKLHPFQPGKLGFVSDYYRIPNTKAHDAGSDAACAGHVYLAFLERYGIIRSDYLNNAQKLWHTNWSESMKEWARGQDRVMNIEPWPTREEWMCYQKSPQSTLFTQE